MNNSLTATPGRKFGAPLAALFLLLMGAQFLLLSVGTRQVMLWIVGAALGVTLYHAAFGFTSAWRVFIRERRGAGLRAQMVMLAVAVVLFFPALGAGTLFGQPVTGLVAPVGISVVVGAFIFGIGMQLGGGCASGTLFTAGGGNARMLVTLLFFILGSLIATHHVDWWFALPSFPAMSVVKTFGVLPALLVNLALFGLIALVTVKLEKRRHGQLEAPPVTDHRGLSRVLRGPWVLVWALSRWHCSITQRWPWPVVRGASPRRSRCGARKRPAGWAWTSAAGCSGRALRTPRRWRLRCGKTSPV